MRYWKALPVVLCSIVLPLGNSPAVLAQGKGETVRIQDYPGTANMLSRIARSKGYCDAHGIRCELQFIASGPLGAQALLAKSIDVGFFPPSVQINAMVKGADFKAIASGSQRNILQVVIHNDLDAPNWEKGYPAFMADLKGKRIGVPARAAGVETDFLLLARNAGLSAEDFTFVANGSPNTAYGSLVSKQVDANVTFSPSAPMCEVLKTCRILYRASEATGPREIVATNGASASFVVTGEFISKSPHVIEALLAALKEAEAFIQTPQNFAEALSIAQSYFKFDLPQGDEIMAAQLKRAIPSHRTGISRAALKQIAENMLQAKLLDAPFDTSGMVYDKGLAF